MNTLSEKASAPRPSFPVRFIRWMFCWRTLRRALLTLAGLFTLIALIFAEENWRGKRAWEKFRREWEAKGERFDLAAFLPKPVPDDQNFVMTPFFAPLLERERSMAAGNWKDTNVLQSTLDVYGGVDTDPSKARLRLCLFPLFFSPFSGLLGQKQLFPLFSADHVPVFF